MNKGAFLVYGSPARLDGVRTIAETGVSLNMFVESIFPVGDLDGDGAGDLLTRSNEYPEVDEDGRYRHMEDDAWESAMLHIHYGIPGELATPLR